MIFKRLTDFVALDYQKLFHNTVPVSRLTRSCSSSPLQGESTAAIDTMAQKWRPREPLPRRFHAQRRPADSGLSRLGRWHLPVSIA